MTSSPTSCVSKILEKLIKPLSPTPLAQRWYKLSLIDQAMSNLYIPFSFFYTKKQLDDVSIDPTQVSSLLEESLSKTLTSYYPYAGRLKDNTTVDCNDAGAELVQVQINFPISEALQYHKDVIEEMVFPKGLPWSDCSDRGLVVAQISYFTCGGIAVSVCFSHKVGDGSSATNLLYDWAATTRDPNDEGRRSSRCLHYVQDSIFPLPPTGTTPFVSPVRTSLKDDSVQRKYIFSAQKLNELKALVSAESTVQNPTRNDVVSALLFKCMAAAAAAAKQSSGNSSFRPWIMTQSFDLRQQIGLSPYSIGNLQTSYFIFILSEEDMTLSNIVTQMRKEKNQVMDRDNVKDNQLLNQFLEQAASGRDFSTSAPENLCPFTNIVKFPLHEIDFGWGKPAKVGIPRGLYKRVVILMGNQSGGIDAFVSLPEQEMSIFDHNLELLEYATPVPSI